MDRIKNVMQRLIDVYQGKHPKTAIDIDLMLDYTRVMYADLLEWHKSFGEEPANTESEAPKAVAGNPAKEEKTEQKIRQEIAPPQQPADIAVPEVQEEKTIPEGIPDEPVAPQIQQEEEPKEEYSGREEIIQQEAEEEKNIDKPQAVEIEIPAVEPEPVAPVNSYTSGISFEPPASRQVEEPPVKEEIAVITESREPEITEPRPVQQQQAKSTIPGTLFSIPPVKKDIRSVIGINDKYLFLNELFNNNKEEYEDILNRLNQEDHLDNAVSWIKSEVAPVFRWDDNDSTVETFYHLLSKHFSSK